MTAKIDGIPWGKGYEQIATEVIADLTKRQNECQKGVSPLNQSSSDIRFEARVNKLHGGLPTFDVLPEDGGSDIESCDPEEQFVITGTGAKEPVDFRKIINKVEQFSKGLNVQPHLVSQGVISAFKPGCTTHHLRIEAVKAAHNFPTHNGDYKRLACRLLLDDMYRRTPHTFSDAMGRLYYWGTLNDEYWGFVNENRDDLDKIIDISKDHKFNFMGLSTMSQIYMLKVYSAYF
jgi:hypothetical protein